MGWEHGTHDGYANHRCRCDPCKQANITYLQNWRAGVGIPDRVHGTYNGYTNYYCRCEGCRQAYSQIKAARRKARKRQ